MLPATAPSAPPDYFTEPERIQATARSQEIARLRHYYDGTQYDGRPEFFSGKDANGNDVPLRERKPCIIYPLPKAACNQATRFTFGEGRFPQIAVGASEEEDEDGPLALDEESAETLTRYLQHVIESSRLKSAMRRLLRIGLSQRSAVVVLSLRRGRFAFDMPRPQDCAVEFVDGDPESDVKRLVWCYPFQKEILRNGKVDTEAYLFRRDYTETEIVFYEDAKVEPNKPPIWVRDESKTRAHKLGFCPVRWIRNLPAEACEDIDGTSIYEGLEDELDALNFSLSQRHRGIVYFGSPQAWEKGVSEDEQPAALARTERPAKTTTAPNAKDPWTSTGGGRARKKAPDQVWSYRSPEAMAAVMETTGKAFEAATAHVIDIRSRILETMDIVLMDTSDMARGEVSAKAIERMFAPLTSLVDELRDCWWSSGLSPILGMVLRITVAVGGKGILVPQAERVAEICRPFLQEFTDPTLGAITVWTSPRLLPSWGVYFSPTNEEVSQLVDATVAARDGGLIGDATAKRNLAAYFGETDTDEDDEPAAKRSPSGGEDEDDMDPLHMDTFAEDRRLLLPSAMLSKLRLSKLGSLGDFAVWSVDGGAVRGLDPDFKLGGNASRYIYIPDGEIWIDQGLADRPADLACVALHHAIEAKVMADGEISHDCAHHAAEAMERILRQAFASGIAAALTPAEALAVASTWLPGLLGAAEGLAEAHAAAEMPEPPQPGEVPGQEPAAPGAPQPAKPKPGQKPGKKAKRR